MFTLLFLALTPVLHTHINTVRDYYLCAESARNCQATIKELVLRATKSIRLNNIILGHNELGVAIFDAHDRNIPIEAVTDGKDTVTMSFLAGNRIPTWIDRTHGKKFIIIDDQILITGPFNFTGKNGNNAEVIEVENNLTIASIYTNEFTKHKKHSHRVVIDAN